MNSRNYRVVHQMADESTHLPMTSQPARLPYSNYGAEVTSEIIQAHSVLDAIMKWTTRREHPRSFIVSVEELHAVHTYSNEDIAAALTQSGHFDPDDFDPDDLVLERFDFPQLVIEVCAALRSCEVLPGTHISFDTTGGPWDRGLCGVVIYVVPEDDGIDGIPLRATYSRLNHLTDDHTAPGWAGIIAVARSLIHKAQLIM